MTDFKQQYKNPRPGFGDADHRRYLRAYNHDKSRREVRTRTFDKNRNLPSVSTPNTEPDITSITDERMKKLIRWREERNRKKKLEAATKKPAFKVGIVHHSLCSPRIKDNTSTVVKSPKKTEHSNYIQKRITRATEKRLLAKAIAGKQPIKNPTFVSLQNPVNTPSFNTKKQKSFAPADYRFKPPSGLKKLPLFGLVSIKQTPQENNTPSQKRTQTSNSATKKNFKTSTNPKLSNKKKSSQKSNESTVQESKLNTTITKSEEQENNQMDIQDFLPEENSSLSSTDTITLSKSSPTSSEKENCVMEDLIVFSPYLTRTRGKRNSRIEGQQRLGIGRPSDEIPTKETVMKNLNICVEEEERTAQYFKFLVNKETDRLNELCKKWLNVGLENNIPEDATYEIQQAVGQTNLLMNKKFERFRSLVQDCETGRGEMLVTCRDLQGFWDMTYMEIKDCDMRFEKLEQRQNRGWQEEEYVVAKPAVKKRVPVKKQAVSSKPSSLRSLILAARKNKMEAGTLNKEVFLPQDIHINEKLRNRKSFTEFLEENTDIRRSARKSKSHDLNESKSTPARRESSKVSSLQKVQLSDKSKRMRSPFAAMKISQMCKTPEVQLDDTVSYVNSTQTPGKSILKKSEELENKEARMKSAYKVNFDDQVVLTEAAPLDEEMQTKLNLAAALNRIDNFDLDEINPLISLHSNVEKQLDFEDSDSSDDLNELKTIALEIKKRNKSNSSIQNTSDTIVQPLNIIPSISIEELSPNNVEIISPKKILKKRRKDTSNRKNADISFSSSTRANRDDEMVTAEMISDDMEDLDLGIKVLRNRTIPANNTPKSNRTSKMMITKRTSVGKEENKSPVKLSRKNSLKLSQKDEDKYMTPKRSNTMEIENVTSIGNTAKKRLLRKSVAFDDSCIGCAENKPVLPMTPYSRRSKTPLRQSRSRRAVDEDLVPWETPDRKSRRRRSTRSQLDNL